MPQDTLRPGTDVTESPKVAYNLVAASGDRVVAAGSNPLIVRK